LGDRHPVSDERRHPVLPTLLFLVVSFFDYDRTGLYPAFILDNYREMLTTPATIRVYVSSLKFAGIVWAITFFLGFNIAYFLVFHVRSGVTRTALFLLCIVPFWTSGIIRTIAWIPQRQLSWPVSDNYLGR
jgi:putative spermidine/putrescine transport system permease protein